MEIRSGRINHSITKPVAVLHGGAATVVVEPSRADLARQELKNITHRLRETTPDDSSFLKRLDRWPQGDAEALCLRAVKELEANPRFNAGLGAALQEDGQARVSASFMESRRQVFSAVTNVEGVLNPSELAYYLQFERFTMRDSAGASRLARKLGVPLDELVTPERFEKWVEFRRKSLTEQPIHGTTGTVGCVSVSPAGDLSACTSTGGVGNEPVGRIGDTPTISGNYCNQVCAVSCTGIGEQINHLGLAHRVCLMVENKIPLEQAVIQVLQLAQERKFQLALIAISISNDSIHWCTGGLTPYFSWAALLPEQIEIF